MPSGRSYTPCMMNRRRVSKLVKAWVRLQLSHNHPAESCRGATMSRFGCGYAALCRNSVDQAA